MKIIFKQHNIYYSLNLFDKIFLMYVPPHNVTLFKFKPTLLSTIFGYFNNYYIRK